MALESRNAEPFGGGGGGHTSSCPMSEHQRRAEARLKCLSIVCRSSFVHLTNEVYGYTGWETRRGTGSRTIAAGATRQRIFAQRLLSQTSNSPPEGKCQASAHKWLGYRGQTPLACPSSSAYKIPTVRNKSQGKQGASATCVTLQRSSWSLLSERAMCSLPPLPPPSTPPPNPTCIVPCRDPATR